MKINNKITWFRNHKIVLLLTIFLVSVYLRFHHLGFIHYNEFMDRDCFRAVSLINEHTIPFLGPELKGMEEGRTAGSLVYFLTVIPMLISQHPISVAIFVVLLNIFGIFLCYILCKKYFGFFVAIITAIFFTVSPQAVDIARLMWHPSMAVPFNILFFYFLFRLVIGRKSSGFLFLSAIFSILFQLHISYIMLIPLFFFVLLLFKPQIKRFHILAGILTILIIFSPYFYYENNHSFINTGNLLNIFSSKKPPDFLLVSNLIFKKPVPLINIESFLLGGRMIHFRYGPSERIIDGNLIKILFNLFSWFDVFLFICGVRCLFKMVRSKTTGVMAGRNYALILLWFFLPIVLLSFFRVTDEQIPVPQFFKFITNSMYDLAERYLIIIFPSQFIIMALGLMGFIKKLTVSKAKRLKIYLVWAVLFFSLLGLVVKFYYCNYVSLFSEDADKKIKEEYFNTLKAKSDIAKTLVKELGINKQDFINRVSIDFGVDGFDYVFIYYLNKSRNRINNNLGNPSYYMITLPNSNILDSEDIKIKNIIKKKDFRIIEYTKDKDLGVPVNNFLNPYILGRMKYE